MIGGGGGRGNTGSDDELVGQSVDLLAWVYQCGSTSVSVGITVNTNTVSGCNGVNICVCVCVCVCVCIWIMEDTVY